MSLLGCFSLQYNTDIFMLYWDIFSLNIDLILHTYLLSFLSGDIAFQPHILRVFLMSDIPRHFLHFSYHYIAHFSSHIYFHTFHFLIVPSSFSYEDIFEDIIEYIFFFFFSLLPSRPLQYNAARSIIHITAEEYCFITVRMP